MQRERGSRESERPGEEPVVRKGWAEAARNIAEAEDDVLVLGEFDNAEDSELEWCGEDAAGPLP